MMEYNNIRADEDRADKYNAMIIALALFCVGFIVAAFLGQNDYLIIWSWLEIIIFTVVFLAGLLNRKNEQWQFSKLEINSVRVRLYYGKKQREIDFKEMQGVRLMDLRVPDGKGYRADRFVILQKKESKLHYQIGDYFHEIRQDEDTIPVWYTEERYQKIMTFWYAAHGKEYRGSGGAIAAWSRTGDSFKESE